MNRSLREREREEPPQKGGTGRGQSSTSRDPTQLATFAFLPLQARKRFPTLLLFSSFFSILAYCIRLAKNKTKCARHLFQVIRQSFFKKSNWLIGFCVADSSTLPARLEKVIDRITHRVAREGANQSEIRMINLKCVSGSSDAAKEVGW